MGKNFAIEILQNLFYGENFLIEIKPFSVHTLIKKKNANVGTTAVDSEH